MTRTQHTRSERERGRGTYAGVSCRCCCRCRFVAFAVAQMIPGLALASLKRAQVALAHTTHTKTQTGTHWHTDRHICHATCYTRATNVRRGVLMITQTHTDSLSPSLSLPHDTRVAVSDFSFSAASKSQIERDRESEREELN